ncbi:hypothetical protein C2S53_005499 [Perilla frutescens var. hirtella]|uniref:Uncharacterized protein n=1 Tax=Perilla frutescens var. hirtella TaxID=608512 RepID=A0AAD4PAA1_PERFH|nr:hypothetical protein C2S53_005499 [Perilla frutescens var. hirtella]
MASLPPCNGSIVSSPSTEAEPDLPLLIDRPLPEKGKVLQAVINPLPDLCSSTLLLAGPLPQWRHPSPPLDTYQIPPPPVVIPSMPALPTPLSAHHSFSQETFDGIKLKLRCKKCSYVPSFHTPKKTK